MRCAFGPEVEVSLATVAQHGILGRAAKLLALGGFLLGVAVGPVAAATFGVPSVLDAGGRRNGGPNPPGYITLQGPDAAATRGDTVHQIRLFIEVTGTTLDVRVYDPGNAGPLSSLDELYNGGAGDGSTTYSLRNPANTQIATVTIGADNATTDVRLMRLQAGSFCRIDAAGCNAFSGLSPGLYELRISQTAGDDTNVLGVDIRDASGNPYAAYTTAFSNAAGGNIGATETAALVGVMAGAPITRPMRLYPLVDRGCSVQTSNFDSDGTASASLTDVFGVSTGVTLSGNGDHVEDTTTIQPTAPVSLESDNYGTYTLSNDPGGAGNLIDWRLADFQGWLNDPPARPRSPASPIRVYFPEDAAGLVAPAQPTLGFYARVDSGQNPPRQGQATTFLVAAVLTNPTTQTLTGVQLTVGGLAAGFSTASFEGLVDGASVGCTVTAGPTCTLGASLPAGSVATFRFLATITPTSAGALQIGGSPAALPGAATTTVWAQYTPAFSSATFSLTEARGPVCPLYVTVYTGNNGTALAATRATVRGLRVDAAAGLVEFATGRQRDTVSFTLYGTDDPSGRGARQPLAAPIEAPLRDAPGPTFYRVRTAPIAQRYVVIEELDGAGRRRAAGPFLVNDAALRTVYEQLQVRFGRLARRGHGGAHTVALESERPSDRFGRERFRRHHEERQRPARRGATADGLKIRTRGTGWVDVPLADLAAAGLPPRARARLALTSQGRPVPFEIVGSAAGSVLRFHAERLTTDYAGENAYLLTWRGADPLLLVRLSRSGEPKAPGFARVEKDRYYSVDVPLGDDPYVWDVLTTLDGAWPYDFDPEAGDFDLPGLEPPTGDVPVRLWMRGVTMSRHVVDAALNGVSLGRLEIDGRAAGVLDAVVPADALRAAGNQLELRYETPGAPAGETGMVYLENLDLGVTVHEDGPVDWDVDAYAPVAPSLRSADYLVLTHGRFAAAAARLAQAKAAAGLRPAVVDVERVYDRYSAGVVEARAIAAYLREVARPGLKAVVLLGDASLDPLDHTGFGAASFVPSLVAWDGELGRVPSENLYADLDGDGRPDLAIGRLPAASEEEADALVAKVERQQTTLRELRGRFLMAADNQGPQDAPFLLEAQDAASRLPAGSSVAWSDVAAGIASARASLAAALSDGVALTQYFGHAGEYVWADERLLGVEDVDALASATRETVVFTWACESQAFDGIAGPTVNEALLLAPQGGALASFGPAGITDPSLQRELRLRVNELFVRRRLPLGEAIRRAKAETLAAHPEAQPVVEGFNLLGDPLLRLE
jgi:hypothetical protein